MVQNAEQSNLSSTLWEYIESYVEFVELDCIMELIGIERISLNQLLSNEVKTLESILYDETKKKVYSNQEQSNSDGNNYHSDSIHLHDDTHKYEQFNSDITWNYILELLKELSSDEQETLLCESKAVVQKYFRQRICQYGDSGDENDDDSVTNQNDILYQQKMQSIKSIFVTKILDDPSNHNNMMDMIESELDIIIDTFEEEKIYFETKCQSLLNKINKVSSRSKKKAVIPSLDEMIQFKKQIEVTIHEKQKSKLFCDIESISKHKLPSIEVRIDEPKRKSLGLLSNSNNNNQLKCDHVDENILLPGKSGISSSIHTNKNKCSKAKLKLYSKISIVKSQQVENSSNDDNSKVYIEQNGK